VSALAAAAAVTVGLGAAAASPTPPAGPALALPDAAHGWAAGRGGILRTTDGGATWRLQRPGQVTALDAVDGDTAWALAGRTLLATGPGAAWHALGTPGFAAVDFADARTGLALDHAGTLFASGDGGATWRRKRAPARLDALCVASPTRGWVAHGGTVWRTITAGIDWRHSRLLADGGGFPRPELGCHGKSVWALFHRGVAAGSESYVVFRSLDGGRTWRAVLAGLDQARSRLPRISAYSGPFAVLGRTAVFAGSCGACGNGRGTTTVVRTTDGGRTWRSTTLGLDGYPTAVALADAAHGELIVYSPGSRIGTVLATRNGGRTWRVQLRSRRLAP